jgi:1-acyl-sn-glycerol-3-phosphate acyltransferase
MTGEELQLAIEQNKSVLTQHYDPEYMKGMAHELVELVKVYFRPVHIGFEQMPPERPKEEVPIIFASNHSGMSFPWDGMVMAAGLMEQFDYDLKKLFRPLAAPLLSASNLMNPYLLKDCWKRLGAIDANSLNFETMMNQSDYNVLIYPEGVPGIGKGFNRRYQLQTFSTSMIRMALKYETDIISLLCVNGEYINPHAYRVKWINDLVNKMGIPFLFIGPLTIPMLLFPLIFYSALPSKLTYVVGKRYRPSTMTDKSWDELETEDFSRIRDQIQQGMQEELNSHVEVYGKKPYDMKELLRSLLKHGRDLPYTTPIGWPALFTEFDRRYKKEGKAPQGVIRGWFRFWRIVIKNPIILAYFIPLIGWIPITIKGLMGRKIVKSWEGSKV